MNYKINAKPDETRVLLFDSLSFKDQQDFRKLVTEVMDGKPQRVTVDLTDVKTIDSAGLGLLVILNGQLTKAGGKVTLFRPNEAVARLLSIVQFDKLCTIEP